MKKKVLAVTIVVVVLGVLGYLALNLHSTLRPSAKEKKLSESAALPASPQNSGTSGNKMSEKNSNLKTVNSQPSTPPPSLASRAFALLPATNAIPVLPPATVLDNARVAMHNYHERFGENPVGTNPEITAALLGQNPRQINFVTAESGLRVNDQGEMLDAWGTPFFFHQVSSKEMEIRSAGEDKKMWTFDDLITR